MTTKNILVNGMSIFNNQLRLSHYYMENEAGEHYRFNGVSQLEAGTKYLLNKLVEENEILDKIIVLNTGDTIDRDKNMKSHELLGDYLVEPCDCSPFGFYKKRIIDYVVSGEKLINIDKGLKDVGISEDMIGDVKKVIRENLVNLRDLTYKQVVELAEQAFADIKDGPLKKVMEAKESELNQKLNSYTGDLQNPITLKNIFDDYAEHSQQLKQEIKKWEGALKSYIREYVYNYALDKDIFKEKTKDNTKRIIDIYKSNVDNMFDSINMDVLVNGKYEKDDMAVSNICEKLLDFTKDGSMVNVYMDTQGGDRTLINMVSAAIDLLGNRNVILKELLATEFNPNKISSQMKIVTKEYTIRDLSAGMKAFTNYGKSDELMTYLYKNDLDKDTMSKKLMDNIKKIDEAIQIIDVVGLNEAIKTFKEEKELLNKENYSHANLKIVVDDIKREYGPLLKEDSDVLDTIEWLKNKGFTSVALTYIEGIMPKYYINEKQYFTWDRSKDDYIVKKFKFNSYDAIENAMVNSIVPKINDKMGDIGRAEAIKLMLRKYVEKHIDILKMRGYGGPNQNLYEWAKEHMLKNERLLISVTNNIKNPSNFSTDANVIAKYKSFAMDCKNGKLSTYTIKDDNFKKAYQYIIIKYLRSNMLNDTEKNELIDVFTQCMYEKMWRFFVGLEAGGKQAVYESIIEIDKGIDRGSNIQRINIFLPIKPNSEGNYNKLDFWENLVKFYYKAVTGEKFSFSSYYNKMGIGIPDEDTLKDLYEKIEKETDNQKLVCYYIALKTVESRVTRGQALSKSSITIDSDEFYYKNMPEEIKAIIEKNSTTLIEDDYFYQTMAGVNEDNDKLKEIIGDYSVVKGEKQKKFEKVLLLHAALKQERNNSNHASEKIKRLPVELVNRMIDEYVALVRDIEVDGDEKA